MKRRAIMVDVDGVLIAHPDPDGWSVNLQRDLGISVAALQSVFFRPHWDDVVHGRATLRERLVPALAELSSSTTYDSFVQYWFSHDAHLDKHLLSQLKLLRNHGIEVHLATVQEHERANYLWNDLDLRDNFDGMHYAAALGVSKPAAGFYRSVEVAAGLEPEAIFFIDDKEANVTAARECGWTSAVWTGRETLADLMLQQRWSGS